MEKNDLYSRDIRRQKWKHQYVHHLTGLRHIPVTKNTKCKNALHFVSINLLFRGKTQVPWKTTFVTFSVLGIVYQTLKALSLWQRENSWQNGEVWESRGPTLSSVLLFCWSFVERSLRDLHSNWNVAVLEFGASAPRRGSLPSHFWPAPLEVRLRTSRMLTRLTPGGSGSPASSPPGQLLSGDTTAAEGPSVSSSGPGCCTSSWRRAEVFMHVVTCSCIGVCWMCFVPWPDFFKMSLILCVKRGRDVKTAPVWFAVKRKGNLQERVSPAGNL